MLVVLTNIPTPYRTAFFNVLKEKLAKQNIGFHVLYMAKTEPRRFWEFRAEENHYEYTFLKGFHPTFKGFYPHFNPSVVAQVKNLKPTWILLAGSWNAPSVVQVLLSSIGRKSTTVFWSEGHADAQVYNARILDVTRKFVYNKIDAFVVPNKRSQAYINIFNATAPVGFLPNTVDEEFFCTKILPEKSKLRAEFQIPNEDLVLVSVAAVNNNKGSLELIQAYSLLTDEQQSKLKIIFLGTGDYLDKLVDIKSSKGYENVLILGQKDAREVRSYLHLADFFILPTKLDSNPLTPIEASFMKTPLILSKFAGNHDELLNIKTGFSIDEITPEDIKEQLLKVVDLAPQQIEAMGEAAYMNVRKRFSRESAAEGLIEFIKTL